MSNEDKAIYISRQRERYKEFQTRKSKSALITEVAAFLQVSRDHAIRVLNGTVKPRKANEGSPAGLA